MSTSSSLRYAATEQPNRSRTAESRASAYFHHCLSKASICCCRSVSWSMTGTVDPATDRNAASAGRGLQHGHQLDVLGHREQVERTQVAELPVGVQEDLEVAREGGRVAGNVRNPAWSQANDRLRDLHAGPGPRRVEHDKIGAPDPAGDGRGVDRDGAHLDVR